MSAVAECVADPPASRPSRPPGPRSGVHRLSALTQAMDLKDVAYRDGTADSTPVHIKAALMRAWVDLQEMAMALRGQGKPKPVEARNAVRKVRGSQSVAPIAPAVASSNAVDKSA